jgi:chemotaxis signal transduction protein
MECLLCSLGSARVAVPRGEMIEILEVPQVTPLPGTYAWVSGVAEVRGKLAWVVALDASANARTKLIRLASDAREIAISIDASHAFEQVERTQKTPSGSSEQGPRFTVLARGPSGPVWLLDTRALLEASQ